MDATSDTDGNAPANMNTNTDLSTKEIDEHLPELINILEKWIGKLQIPTVQGMKRIQTAVSCCILETGTRKLAEADKENKKLTKIAAVEQKILALVCKTIPTADGQLAMLRTKLERFGTIEQMVDLRKRIPTLVYDAKTREEHGELEHGGVSVTIDSSGPDLEKFLAALKEDIKKQEDEIEKKKNRFVNFLTKCLLSKAKRNARLGRLGRSASR